MQMQKAAHLFNRMSALKIPMILSAVSQNDKDSQQRQMQ